MKKVIFLTVIVLSIIFDSTVCNAVNLKDYNLSESDISGLSEKDFLGLTQEQMLEDYEYYWKTVNENCPLISLSERQNRISESYETYKQKLLNSESNLEQMECIVKLSDCLSGHPSYMPSISDLKKVYGKYIDVRKTWYDKLLDPLSEKNNNLYKFFKEKNLNPIEDTKNVDHGDKLIDENVETKIIEDGNIAYMKIRSFGNQFINQDTEKQIFNFYSDIKDFKNLIIDITGNSGGDTNYLVDYIFPILCDKLVIKDYFLLKMGDENKSFIKEAFGKDNISILPISELPEFKALNALDKNEMTHFLPIEWTIVPKKRVNFHGKIWLLVDEKVFSTSEGLASACKENGCAVLVGKRTGGDGVGIDPALLVLPNSKIVFRYSMMYGLNADGSCNAEAGTEPDIISKEGESPLDTCLNEINSATLSLKN